MNFIKKRVMQISATSGRYLPQKEFEDCFWHYVRQMSDRLGLDDSVFLTTKGRWHDAVHRYTLIYLLRHVYGFRLRVIGDMVGMNHSSVYFISERISRIVESGKKGVPLHNKVWYLDFLLSIDPYVPKKISEKALKQY
jgi:hypothetical protein